MTYKWTVSEGSLTNDSNANTTFDSFSLNFEDVAQAQSKTVMATVTVTDEHGQTAFQSTTITVNCPPPFVREGDLIFAKNNARVNNCGKRLLIDTVAPQAARGGYDIVLVGHRDKEEAVTVGTPGVPLDYLRVLNAAAVLVTCGKVKPSSIKIDWVGFDANPEAKPNLYGEAVKEEHGSEISEADRNRRVEIHADPHNSTTAKPPEAQNARNLPPALPKISSCEPP